VLAFENGFTEVVVLRRSPLKIDYFLEVVVLTQPLR
jgi:hypothetical protein